MTDFPKSEWHSIELSIPFPSPQHASIALRAISVDPELRSSEVDRTLSLSDSNLLATFRASTIRQARLSVNAFLENVDLVLRTLAEFAPENARGEGRGEVVRDEDVEGPRETATHGVRVRGSGGG